MELTERNYEKRYQSPRDPFIPCTLFQKFGQMPQKPQTSNQSNQKNKSRMTLSNQLSQLISYKQVMQWLVMGNGNHQIIIANTIPCSILNWPMYSHPVTKFL